MKCFTANSLAIVALLSLLAPKAMVTAFVVSPTPAVGSRSSSSETMLFMSSPKTGGETEVERLLRMARELRAQAEASEKEVHVLHADKKADREVRLGSLLNHLFYDGTKGRDIGNPAMAINDRSVVVERLRSKKPSTDTLEKLVDWMDDRRDLALGYEHLESRGETYVSVKNEKNTDEADRLFQLSERLLDALEIVDAEKKHEHGHLGGGHNAEDLRQRLQEKRRQRDEQFLERQQSFVDAQTIKEGKSKYEYHDENLDDRE